MHGHDRKPKRRLFELLKAQGLQANQDVTFLADGGEEVRALTELVTPEAEHVLDWWFHIVMRLTVLERSMSAAWPTMTRRRGHACCAPWSGSNGCSGTATGTVPGSTLTACVTTQRSCRWTTRTWASSPGRRRSSLPASDQTRAALSGYDERISSTMAESTVNAVVSKRFAKRQQMQ